MTTHYTLHTINYKIDFKVTYRDGKFRKLEHLRGKLNQTLMDSLGKVIPQLETDLPNFEAKYKGRVSYTKEGSTAPTLFGQFNSAWFAFFRKNNNNIDPKFTGADGKALKQIISYLTEINSGNATAALENWNLILNSWDNLNEFHQAQTDLKYINSKLNVIIREIIRKNGVNATGGNSSVSI